jgi:hypothetical protein
VLSDLEQRWLVYARSVFDCGPHLRECDAPAIDGIDPSLRWPGFVGENYEPAPKRLLLVGRVHNPTDWNGTYGVGGLGPLAKSWLSGSLSDEEFYREYSREYARRLIGWGPWLKIYAHLAEAAGADESSIAYVNVAKCWQYPGKESAKQRNCAAAFRLGDLVEAVRPSGVFLLATENWLDRVPQARVRSVPFRCDSAPHFQFSAKQIADAIAWVESL